jgi:hypothetical protein
VREVAALEEAVAAQQRAASLLVAEKSQLQASLDTAQQRLLDSGSHACMGLLACKTRTQPPVALQQSHCNIFAALGFEVLRLASVKRCGARMHIKRPTLLLTRVTRPILTRVCDPLTCGGWVMDSARSLEAPARQGPRRHCSSSFSPSTCLIRQLPVLFR